MVVTVMKTTYSIHVIETGLSDFHKMIVTVMKTTYRKLEPRIVHYRPRAH